VYVVGVGDVSGAESGDRNYFTILEFGIGEFQIELWDLFVVLIEPDNRSFPILYEAYSVC
jgi:hypothetical protein